MSKSHEMNRRTVFAGVAAAGTAGLLLPGTALAETPTAEPGPAGPAGGRQPQAAPPGLTPISSAPKSGYSYRFVDMWDFTPENFASGRAWSSAGGVYAPLSGGDTMWVTIEIPPGAIVGDVEWYVSATADTLLMGRVWVAGTPTLMKTVVDGVIAGSSTFGLVRAFRIVASTATNGPFPHGTKLALGVFTPADYSVAVNGVRIGFTKAPTGQVLLSKPVRMYDSRSGARIAAGQVRTHQLASQVPVGATGVLLNVTVTGTQSSGFLTVYASDQSAPGTSSINWDSSGRTLANAVTSAIPASRSINVRCGSSSTHYIVDLVGYLA